MSEEQTRAPTFLRKRHEILQDARKRVIAVSQQPTMPFLKLAVDLHKIHGLVSAAEFREVASEAGMSVRKAYNLVSIVETLKKHWDQPRYEQIGWTKLCIIAAHVEKGSPVKQWLTFAEKHTARECQLHLKGKPYKQETRCMLLRFDDRQFAIFTDAIMKYGAKQKANGFVGTEKALISAMRKMRRAELI